MKTANRVRLAVDTLDSPRPMSDVIIVQLPTQPRCDLKCSDGWTVGVSVGKLQLWEETKSAGMSVVHLLFSTASCK